MDNPNHDFISRSFSYANKSRKILAHRFAGRLPKLEPLKQIPLLLLSGIFAHIILERVQMDALRNTESKLPYHREWIEPFFHQRGYESLSHDQLHGRWFLAIDNHAPLVGEIQASFDGCHIATVFSVSDDHSSPSWSFFRNKSCRGPSYGSQWEKFSGKYWGILSLLPKIPVPLPSKSEFIVPTKNSSPTRKTASSSPWKDPLEVRFPRLKL